MPAEPTRRSGGYVTTFASIDGMSSEMLERALGFPALALEGGFHIYALSEPIGSDDFSWKDRTAYSDGWHFDPTINEYVQRSDELRYSLFRQSGWNEGKADAELNKFMELQREALNVRSGPHRIVKVFPARKPTGDYPDSRFRTIPQWRLTKEKLFTLIR